MLNTADVARLLTKLGAVVVRISKLYAAVPAPKEIDECPEDRSSNEAQETRAMEKQW